MGSIIHFENYKRKNGVIFIQGIKKDKMLEIEKITQDLVSELDFEKSPYVDIVSMVKKEAFEVKTSEMDIETTGCLLVNNSGNNNERIIIVNTKFKNPDNEKDVIFKKSRFITAHEYGHFKLHSKEGQTIYAHRDTYHRTEPIELEADYFARSILMPLEQFKIYYEILKQMAENDEKFQIDTLSRIFGVTRNKVKIRMEDLSVLEQ